MKEHTNADHQVSVSVPVDVEPQVVCSVVTFGFLCV